MGFCLVLDRKQNVRFAKSALPFSLWLENNLCVVPLNALLPGCRGKSLGTELDWRNTAFPQRRSPDHEGSVTGWEDHRKTHFVLVIHWLASVLPPSICFAGVSSSKVLNHCQVRGSPTTCGAETQQRYWRVWTGRGTLSYRHVASCQIQLTSVGFQIKKLM